MVKEAGAADDAVGDAVALKGKFQLAGLGVHPVEHGVIPPVGALAEGGHDMRGHILGLLVFIVGGVLLNLVSAALIGP